MYNNYPMPAPPVPFNNNYPIAAPPVPCNAQPTREWTTGLCDCCEDPSNCCMTCCCPCVTFGRNAEIIAQGRTSCCGAGLLFCCLSHLGIGCLYSCTYRSKLRGLYSLPPSPCADCCIHCCCGYCALCQEHRELNNRGLDPSIGWARNVEIQNRVRNPQVPPQFVPAMTR